MNNCLICKKIISSDSELCDEHRNILKSIVYDYDRDPEMRRQWDNILELVESKSHSVTSNDMIIDEVLDFIDEIKL
jgi:hypothetical protein